VSAGHSAQPAIQPSREVAEYLRARIASGELRPGARIPPARQLAAERGVALSTAVRAVAELRNEGLIDTVHGRGSFVRVPAPELVRLGGSRYRRHPQGLSPNRDEAEAGGYLDEVDRAEAGTTTATPALAKRLHVKPGAPLSVVRYRWLAAGRPTQISTQWEPLALTAGTPAEQPVSAAPGQPSVIARFDLIGLRVTRVVEDLRARMPRPEERADLEMPEGIPVLAITRTHWADATPVETADIVIRADRTVIRTEHPVGD
jgi:GntR family transcriptional regulator